ncbi:MAG: DUF3352 domain-containing protein [Anaerolineae bacterium]
MADSQGIHVDPPQPHGRGRQLAQAGLVIVLLLAAGLAVAAFLDPFGWHLVDRMRGRYDAALAAVPADSSFYVGVNLLNVDQNRLGEIRTALDAATAGTTADFGDARRNLDEMLTQQLGLSLEQDILPWLGQYIGLAVLRVEPDEDGRLAAPDWVLSVETRDRDAADRFLEKLRSGWADFTGTAPAGDEYQGVTITYFDTAPAEARIAFARSKGLVLFGSGPRALRAAIEAQRGNSLADTGAFSELMPELPRGRLLTAFVNGSQLDQIAAVLPEAVPESVAANAPTAAIRGIALSLSLTDAGVQIDGVTAYDEARLSDAQRRALETYVAGTETAVLYPAETYLFLAGRGINLIWDYYHERVAAEMGESDFKESMSLFARQFGINPDTELFPFLDGDAAVGVMRVAGGKSVFPGAAGLGATAVIGSSDPDTLAAHIAAFSDSIGDPVTGLGTVEKNAPGNDLVTYHFESVLFPAVPLNYGVGRGYLLLGSSQEALSELWPPAGESLADGEGFRQATEALPEGMAPGLYLDVAGLLAFLGQETALEPAVTPFRAISTIAAGGRADGNLARFTVLVNIPAN